MPWNLKTTRNKVRHSKVSASNTSGHLARLRGSWHSFKGICKRRYSLLSPPGKLITILLVILSSASILEMLGAPTAYEVSYGEFLGLVNSGEVSDLTISDQRIRGYLKKEGRNAVPFVTYRLNDETLARNLAAKSIRFGVEKTSGLSLFFFSWVLPFILIAGFWVLLSYFVRPTGLRGMFHRKRPIPLVHDASERLTFADVAGTREAKTELGEIISFLRNPDRVQRLGGRMPKGVLLIGAPGTGKTLLAKAVAGEAAVPFFNISGAEFIEMFVGVGAARVRELFDEAREHAPCMIFIDELDAIGRSRSGPNVMLAHDEREQTLNQLLTEMDGFDSSQGIIVMAATNRPEILDRALLRAGRFDRQIVVDKPGLEDREDILNLHARLLVMAEDVDLHVVAQRTPGLVGADLANICNEAAIIAVRENAPSITMKHFELSLDRIIAGPEKRSLVLSKSEKERVACHEAGHALVAELLTNTEPVHKVSIIPRGAASLGFTLQLPLEDRFLSTEPQLYDQLAVLMAGRSAEKLVFGSYSNGAMNDLEAATQLTRKMVCEWGMSPQVGPVTLGRRHRLFFLEPEGGEERNFSEASAQEVDGEVKRIVQNAQQTADELLISHENLLKRIVEYLVENEVMEREVLARLVDEDSTAGD